MVWNLGWDQIFSDHEWGRYPPEDLIRFIASNYYKITPRSSVAILEVGCGPGANIWYLAREGFSVFGVDGSSVAIERAKQRLSKEGLNADLKVADIMKIPYPDAFFDAVIDIECIYANSMADSRIIVDEIKRVLKPGGRFFSKTFSTGTYGDGNGIKLEGEERTYVELFNGALKKGYGIIRFNSEEDIHDLYSIFQIESIDYIIRSENNQKYEIREWLIECKKSSRSDTIGNSNSRNC
jgi:SAM-dependent methyltransferase